jgi:hypothetical protein
VVLVYAPLWDLPGNKDAQGNPAPLRLRVEEISHTDVYRRDSPEQPHPGTWCLRVAAEASEREIEERLGGGQYFIQAWHGRIIAGRPLRIEGPARNGPAPPPLQELQNGLVALNQGPALVNWLWGSYQQQSAGIRNDHVGFETALLEITKTALENARGVDPTVRELGNQLVKELGHARDEITKLREENAKLVQKVHKLELDAEKSLLEKISDNLPEDVAENVGKLLRGLVGRALPAPTTTPTTTTSDTTPATG